MVELESENHNFFLSFLTPSSFKKFAIGESGFREEHD